MYSTRTFIPGMKWVTCPYCTFDGREPEVAEHIETAHPEVEK